MVMCVHTHILTRAFLPRHDQRGESPRSISRSDCLDSSAEARARLSDVRNASNKRLSTILLQQPLNATLHSQVATKLTDGKPNGTTTNNLSAPVLLNSPIDDDDGIKAHFVPLCVPYYYTAAHSERRGIRKKAADQPR